MMLTDSTDKLMAMAGYETIKFFAPERFVRPEIEHIRRWDFAREVQPGLFVHTDYDLTRPSVDLRTQKALPRGYTPSDFEIYDYPGYYDQKPDGEHYAAVRIDEFGTQFETAQADTNARGVAVGSLFTLDGHPRADQNREHVIIAASYDLRVQRLRGDADRRGAADVCVQLRGDVERAAVPSAARRRPSRSCRGRRRRWSSARRAKRSTPTSTAA